MRGQTIPTRSPLGQRAYRQICVFSVVAGASGALSLIGFGKGVGAPFNSTVLAHQVSPFAAAWPWLATAVIFASICALSYAAADYIGRQNALDEESRLRVRTLDHIFAIGHLPRTGAGADSAKTTASGALVSTLVDGSERVSKYEFTFLPQAISALITPLVVLVLAAIFIDPLSALELAGGVAVAIGASLAVSRLTRGSAAGSRRQRSALAAQYLDAVQGLSTLVLARAGERYAQRLAQRGEANRRALMRLLAGNQLVILATDLFTSVFILMASIAIAAAGLDSGRLDAGDALALALVALVLLDPLNHVGAFFYVGMGGRASQKAICNILATPTPASSAPAPVPAKASSYQQEEVDTAAIFLRDVSVGWGDKDVLKNVNLRVELGEHIGIVGRSGAGKSTLMALLAGHLLPREGYGRLGPIRLRPANMSRVQRSSALVSQRSWLFGDTVAQNLRLAKPEATTEELWHALEVAQLDTEIRALPKGLETMLGDSGMGLSGGQAQRLAIARAVLADRPILLLDEPTSQVDLASEAAIIKALENLGANRTVVTISHRPAALIHTDRTFKVSKGRLHELTPRKPKAKPTGPAQPTKAQADQLLAAKVSGDAMTTPLTSALASLAQMQKPTKTKKNSAKKPTAMDASSAHSSSGEED